LAVLATRREFGAQAVSWQQLGCRSFTLTGINRTR